MLGFGKSIAIGVLTGLIEFLDFLGLASDDDSSSDGDDAEKRRAEADDFHTYQEIEAQRRATSHDPWDKNPYDWSDDQNPF